MGRSVRHTKGTSTYTLQVKRDSLGGSKATVYISGMIRGARQSSFSLDDISYGYVTICNVPRCVHDRTTLGISVDSNEEGGVRRRALFPSRSLAAKPDPSMLLPASTLTSSHQGIHCFELPSRGRRSLERG